MKVFKWSKVFSRIRNNLRLERMILPSFACYRRYFFTVWFTLIVHWLILLSQLWDWFCNRSLLFPINFYSFRSKEEKFPRQWFELNYFRRQLSLFFRLVSQHRRRPCRCFPSLEAWNKFPLLPMTILPFLPTKHWIIHWSLRSLGSPVRGTRLVLDVRCLDLLCIFVPRGIAVHQKRTRSKIAKPRRSPYWLLQTRGNQVWTKNMTVM